MIKNSYLWVSSMERLLGDDELDSEVTINIIL